MHLELGTLVENNSREFSVVVDGREVAVIYISDAPAGGFVATTTESCPSFGALNTGLTVHPPLLLV